MIWIIKSGCSLICIIYDMGISKEVSIFKLVNLNIMGNKIKFGMVWVKINIDIVIIYDINESILVIFMFCLVVFMMVFSKNIMCVIILILVIVNFVVLLGFFWCINLFSSMNVDSV